MVSNENIEIVNNYTYLEVKFSANGSFTNHKENLTVKARRSFFAARPYLDFLSEEAIYSTRNRISLLNVFHFFDDD